MMHKTVQIKINGQTASKRTRNRVKENGPTFTILDQKFFDRFNEECFLLRSPKGFFGWLPISEIIVVNTEGK